MTAPKPPDWLSGEYERAAWNAGYASAALHGSGWHPTFVHVLGLFASSAGRYCRLTIAQQAGWVPIPEDVAELASLRMLVRQMMTDWFLLPVRRVPLGEIRPDRLDADIAALCGIQ
jgi:hypothetical protein